MEDIYLYTPEFRLLYIIPRAVSVWWDLFYDDVGKVEIYLDKDDDVLDVLLSHDDIIISQGKNSAWISGFYQDSKKLAIFGKTLSHMLSWRVCMPFRLSGAVDDIVYSKVSEAFIKNSNNKIDTFFVGEKVGEVGQTDYSISNEKTLLEVVKELCSMESLGFRVDFDPLGEKYVFLLYKGRDRRAQGEDPLVYSEEDKNINDIIFFKKMDEYFTCGYCQGDLVIKTDAFGFYKRDCILKAKNIGEADYELNKKEIISEIEGNCDSGTSDVELGDIVTLQKKFNDFVASYDIQIKEIIYLFEAQKSIIRPVLKQEGRLWR
ncbi:MAG: hypothetical protein GX196_04445 [Clostridiaceae bacterium]|nr:hypothetical protein [Clostridiaceae bacterium]